MNLHEGGLLVPSGSAGCANLPPAGSASQQSLSSDCYMGSSSQQPLCFLPSMPFMGASPPEGLALDEQQFMALAGQPAYTSGSHRHAAPLDSAMLVPPRQSPSELHPTRASPRFLLHHPVLGNTMIMPCRC